MTSHTMNILGRVATAGLATYGGADNYFFDPEATPAPLVQRRVVWGGVCAACPDWYFADEGKPRSCAITGNPNSPVPYGYFIRVRSIRIWPKTVAGFFYLKQWAGQRYWGAYLQPGVPIMVNCGEGWDTGTMPYVELTTEASAEIVYDLVQGRFP